jgi:hypothetical protein
VLSDNFIKYSERVELFISRSESLIQAARDQAQKLQLENILNEVENGILILNKSPNFSAKYAN